MAGVTHALNTVADGLRLPLEFAPSTRAAAVPLPEGQAPPEVEAVWDEIAAFYAMDRVPGVFRWMGRDPVFLQGFWGWGWTSRP